MTDKSLQSNATEGEPILRAEGVTFGYEPGLPVVRGVDGAAQAGRVTALLGPNAAGKSTLLKLMLGHLRPDSGRVLLDGEDVAGLPPRARAMRVSYVPQRGGVSFAFTVREVVAMGRFAMGGGDGAIEAAIEACGLREEARRPFAELSGGQQQRVLVARALAQSDGGGRAMLLDEPTSSADLRHVHGLMALLRAQAARRLAVVVVLHDLNLAARYADDVWLMRDGELAAAGGWRDVLRPELLEATYGVPLRVLDDAGGRPTFIAEPAEDRLVTAR